jgi:microcystin degradation protein MlrC
MTGRMRIAALGLHHETNTFSSFPTTYESFSTSSYGGILRGEEIEQHQRASHSTFAGYFQAAEEFGFDLVPLLFAVNDPSGTITRDAFTRVADEMMRLLTERGPWNGVLLNQMGAAVSEDFRDVDGEVATRFQVVAWDAPLLPLGLLISCVLQNPVLGQVRCGGRTKSRAASSSMTSF